MEINQTKHLSESLSTFFKYTLMKKNFKGSYIIDVTKFWTSYDTPSLILSHPVRFAFYYFRKIFEPIPSRDVIYGNPLAQL